MLAISNLHTCLQICHIFVQKTGRADVRDSMLSKECNIIHV